MKKASVLLWCLLVLSPAAAQAAEGGGGLPVMNGKEVIATVNGAPVYLTELNAILGSVRGHGAGEAARQTGKIDYATPLNRLIDTRLIQLEAENIGLGELPEVVEQMGVYERQARREFLLDKATMGVKADPKEVERRYREEIKHYVLQSLKFAKEEEAKKAAAELKAGKDFSMLAAKALSGGGVEGNLETEEHRAKEVVPQLGAVLAKMKKGEVSPAVPITGGFVIMKLKDVTYKEDPAFRQVVEKAGAEAERAKAKLDYVKKLQEKHAKIDRELLKKLDFEAKEPGFAALLEDKRPLATIKGEAPVTVGDLAGEIKMKFFHGVDRAIKKGDVNEKKSALLDKILAGRVVEKEALAQGIDKGEVYRQTVAEYRRSMLFSAYLGKALIPNLGIGEEDLEQYHQAHLQDFSSPHMVRLKSLVFSSQAQADEALVKLRGGTDFGWLASNAPGQVAPESEGVLALGGKLLMLDTLPDELRTLLAKLKKGDLKSYADGNGHFYALQVEEVVEPTTKPLAEVREEVKEKVFALKLQEAIAETARKLREHYEVSSYADRLMGMSAGQ